MVTRPIDPVAATRAAVHSAVGLRWRRFGGMTVVTLELGPAGSVSLPLVPSVTLAITPDRGGRVTATSGEESLVGPGIACAVAERTATRYAWSRPHHLRLFFVEPGTVRLDGTMGVVRDEVARHVLGALEAVCAEPRHPSQAATALALVHALDGRFVEPGAAALAETFGPGSLRKIELFVERNLDQDLTIEVLARAIGISRAHFARQFRASTGLTPMTYVTRARIARAKELLASGARGATIAVTVGFCDQSHFNRVFKREVGVTPGAFVAAGARSGSRRGGRL